jgi:hypothetical protein
MCQEEHGTDLTVSVAAVFVSRELMDTNQASNEEEEDSEKLYAHQRHEEQEETEEERELRLELENVELRKRLARVSLSPSLPASIIPFLGARGAFIPLHVQDQVCSEGSSHQDLRCRETSAARGEGGVAPAPLTAEAWVCSSRVRGRAMARGVAPR